MAKTFHLNILTADKAIYDGDALSLTAPGEAGYLGVLADHAPLVTTLVAGKIILKDPSGQPTVFESKGKGFLEVLKNEVAVFLTAV